MYEEQKFDLSMCVRTFPLEILKVNSSSRVQKFASLLILREKNKRYLNFAVY